MRGEKQNDIQWLRTIAALEVVVWHSDLSTKHFSDLAITDSWYAPFGGIGVDLFFIISGYVMCMRAPAYPSGAAFLYSRMARLAPMYWLFTSLVLLAYFTNPGWRLGAREFDLAIILQSYLIFPGRDYPILGVGWTLEHEVAFYAVVGLFMWWSRDAFRSGHDMAFALILLGTLGFLLGTGPSAQVWDYKISSPYMLAFGLGWLIRTSEEAQKPPMLAWAMFAGAALLSLLVAHERDVVLLYRMLLAGCVFLGFTMLRHVWQTHTFLNRAGAAVGEASYSLYLSHWFVLSILGKLLGLAKLPPVFDGVTRLLAVFLCVGVALLVFRSIEKPVDRWLRQPRLKRPLPSA